jgi:hypothetical protein
MAEDILEEAFAKLPALVPAVNEKEVKRSEVYCSKIIHQKASHQSRFTWTTVYRKIMAYNGYTVEGPPPYPRPLRSPFPCYQCHRPFACPPCFIPIIVLNGSRTEWGNFCDPSCANTYLHTCMNDSNLAARVADLYEYVQDVHGFSGERIHYAPHFSQRELYGGELTDAKFDVIAKTPGLRTFERMAPFVPTSVVIEYQCRVEDMEGGGGACADEVGIGSAAAVGAAGAAGGGNATGTGARTIFGGADKRKGASTAAEALAKLIGYKPETANHHHQWEVHGLRQPSLADIEKRLLNLPQPDEKEGLYGIYWERHGAGAPLPDEATDIKPPTPAKSKRQKTGSGSTGAFSSLTSMLIPTNKIN